MHILLRLVVMVMVATLAVGQATQELPDTPSTAQPPAPAATRPHLAFWDRPQLTWHETFTSKRWLIPTAFMAGAKVFDIEVTHAGLAHHVCLESNNDLPLRPSRGELYRNMLVTTVPIALMGAAFTKLKAPWPIYAGMAGYGTVVNTRGAVTWLRDCW